MRHILTLTILFLTSCFYEQKTRDYLISFSDTTTGEELMGYKDKFGKIIIDAKYTHVYTDTLYSMAIVLKNWEWVGIDKSENVILKSFIFDNGPDYLQEGLFRFIENNKIGFADIDGQKIIKAKYDFATPFDNGLSEYTLGGQREYEKGGEHWSWTGGYESGYINHDGQEFIKVTDLKNNQREAWTKDKKHFLLNHKGQITKRLK
ncbi:MAG: WG repeat-containing protein [Chitinophagia bacterium]|nr:WG repeat-containing protein [Chitinophagia bacterium]